MIKLLKRIVDFLERKFPDRVLITETMYLQAVADSTTAKVEIANLKQKIEILEAIVIEIKEKADATALSVGLVPSQDHYAAFMQSAKVQ